MDLTAGLPKLKRGLVKLENKTKENIQTKSQSEKRVENTENKTWKTL